MSPAVTAPGPCLRTYMVTGSSSSEAHHESLEVQDDVGDIFLDSGNGGEFVEDAVDTDAGDSSAGDRRQQGAAERVTECVTEAGLERLDDEFRAVVGDDLFGQRRAL